MFLWTDDEKTQKISKAEVICELLNVCLEEKTMNLEQLFNIDDFLSYFRFVIYIELHHSYNSDI